MRTCRDSITNTDKQHKQTEQTMHHHRCAVLAQLRARLAVYASTPAHTSHTAALSTDLVAL